MADSSSSDLELNGVGAQPPVCPQQSQSVFEPSNPAAAPQADDMKAITGANANPASIASSAAPGPVYGQATPIVAFTGGVDNKDVPADEEDRPRTSLALLPGVIVSFVATVIVTFLGAFTIAMASQMEPRACCLPVAGCTANIDAALRWSDLSQAVLNRDYIAGRNAAGLCVLHPTSPGSSTNRLGCVANLTAGSGGVPWRSDMCALSEGSEAVCGAVNMGQGRMLKAPTNELLLGTGALLLCAGLLFGGIGLSLCCARQSALRSREQGIPEPPPDPHYKGKGFAETSRSGDGLILWRSNVLIVVYFSILLFCMGLSAAVLSGLALEFARTRTEPQYRPSHVRGLHPMKPEELRSHAVLLNQTNGGCLLDATTNLLLTTVIHVDYLSAPSGVDPTSSRARMVLYDHGQGWIIVVIFASCLTCLSMYYYIGFFPADSKRNKK